ncbi:MAG: M20/M25/M40 family metallo-hydrolase, partial [Eubacteriales bacterium]
MGVLGNLAPQNVFGWFETICAIPHGSGHITAISDFLAEFGRQRNLETIQEPCGNVIIKKPATAGYENKPTVILQGHMDMVCEKTPETVFDFRKDGLCLVTDGVKVWADGTTLGGDNGIAVAYSLAILDSDTIQHPSLEAVFTTDEEVGMVGATALDGNHLQGRMLLNLDSEEAGVLTVGCAGGARATITLPVQSAPAHGDLFQLDIGGLVGGHSGIDTGKGRGNANKLLGEALSLLAELVDIRLCYVKGGAQNNAIPRDATALFVAPADQGAWIFKVLQALEGELHQRF